MSTINLHNYEAFLLDYSEGNLNVAEVAQLKLFLLGHPELDIDFEDFNLVYLEEEHQGFAFKQELKKSEDQVPDEELINYLEGNFSLEDKIAFELKITQDSDLATTLEDYKKTILLAESNVVLESGAGLKKSEDDFVLNNRVLAYFENQLDPSQKTEFESELQNNVSLQKELAIYSRTVLAADSAVFHPDKASLKKEAKIIFFNLRTVGSIAAALLLMMGLALVYNYYGNKKVESSSLAVTPPSQLEIAPLATPTAALRAKMEGVEEQIAKNPAGSKINFSAAKQMLVADNPKDAVQEEAKKESVEIAEKEDIIIKETPFIKEHTTEIASQQNSDILDSTHRKNYLVLAEDIAYEDDLIEVKESSSAKKGLWKRAVLLAQQANKFGVKSIDGQENSKNNYRLSFNSFSVEKK